MRLSDADRLIWSKFRETNDARYVTGWYFEWEPHPKQRIWLAARGCLEKYLATGARFGKSESNAAELLLETMLRPREIVCNTSITQDQAEISWSVAAAWCDKPHLFHWVEDIVHSPFPKITLTHGAELWARSTQYDCKFLRGHKYGRVNYDEIAYGKEADLEVLKMRLADTGGTFSGTTTPRGKNWFFRKCWIPAEADTESAERQKRAPKLFALTGRSYDNPHINHSYLDAVRLTESQRSQEIDGLFVDNEKAVFKPSMIDAATDPDMEADLKRMRATFGTPQWKAPEGRWIVAYDLGKLADWTVAGAMRIDVFPWRVRWFDRYQKQPWGVVERQMETAQKLFQSTQVIFDATGLGGPVGDHLNIAIPYLTPFVFTPQSKTQLITNLQYCLENQKFKMPFIEQLQEELFGYEWNDKDLPTDCVMMLALLCWVANTEKPAMEVI